MRIAIICICYNSYKEFLLYYESIRVSESLSNSEVKIFLLDNSTISDKKRIKKIKKLCDSDKNLQYQKCFNNGYLGTLQNEYKKLNIKSSEFDFISFSNVDIKMEKYFLKKLENIKLKPSIGILAPSIITKKFVNKNPKLIKRKSILKLILNIIIFYIPFAYKIQNILSKYKFKLYEKFKHFKDEITSNKSKIMEIYCAHGSFLLFKPYAFDLIIKNRYPIFLFGEELFFAEILRLRKIKTLFISSLKIFDDEHVSTGKLSSLIYGEFNRKALIYILKRFYINKKVC